MGNLYETDIVAWASEQAELLRSGQWSALDLENIAEEIEDVGKSVQRELSSRVAVLLAHLLKWKFQPELRSRSWLATIAVQRRSLAKRLSKIPSLKRSFFNEEWLDEAWDDAVRIAIAETGLHEFPEEPIWSARHTLDPEFFPD